MTRRLSELAAKLGFEGPAPMRKQPRLDIARRALEQVFARTGSRSRDFRLRFRATTAHVVARRSWPPSRPRGPRLPSATRWPAPWPSIADSRWPGVLLVSDGQSNAGEDAAQGGRAGRQAGRADRRVGRRHRRGPQQRALGGDRGRSGRIRARPDGSRRAGRSSRHARPHRRGRARKTPGRRLDRSRPRGSHLRRGDGRAAA